MTTDIRTSAIVWDAHEVSFGELPESVSMEPIVEGPELAFEKVIADDLGGFLAVWEAQPGIYPRVKHARGSAMLILSGDAVVTDKDGTEHELHEGSILLLPFRWEGTWNITRAIRKVYIYSWPTGEPEQRPNPAVSAAGVDYAQMQNATVLNASDHGAALPDVKAIINSNDVDGICGTVEISEGDHNVHGTDRWTYLYLNLGKMTIEGTEGTFSASRGDVVALPIGWQGILKVTEDVQAFAFLTMSRDENSELPTSFRPAI